MSSFTIKLHKEEEDLFTLLLDSVKWKGNVEGSSEATILRVAGGWVRDKLLDREGKDIDIGLNNQSGVVFANYVNEYLQSIGQEVRTIAVIQANPDQSKHLETANLRVLGFEIDCVNLRAETYTEESRIPEITFGTPLQDALRRDFTINSLFYNLNTREVEDFTGQGLRDLAQGVIRTPISAHITFKDDPLRVLRAIRFSSRLHFSLDEDLVSAASSEPVASALLHKVSRERVYKELDGMMNTSTSRPYVAFALMYRLNILSAVLPVEAAWEASTPVVDADSPPIAFPAEWQALSMETLSWLNVLLSLKQTDSMDSFASYVSQSGGSSPQAPYTVSIEAQSQPKFEQHSRLLFLTAALLGTGRFIVVEKKKTLPFTTVVLRDGLKIDNSSLLAVQTLTDCLPEFVSLAQSEHVNISVAGKLLRVCKELWRDCIVLACAHSLASLALGGQSSVEAIRPERHVPLLRDIAINDQAASVIAQFLRLEHTIDSLGLDKVWLLKPLMNGSELMTRLSLPKGPVVGQVAEEQISWQIRTKSDSVDECVAYLQSVFRQGGERI